MTYREPLYPEVYAYANEDHGGQQTVAGPVGWIPILPSTRSFLLGMITSTGFVNANYVIQFVVIILITKIGAGFPFSSPCMLF